MPAVPPYTLRESRPERLRGLGESSAQCSLPGLRPGGLCFWLDYAVNVALSPLIVAANCCSDRFAGPLTTEPDVVNVDPWFGQTNCEPSERLIVVPSCVHVAVSTLSVVALVRASRNVPIDVWVMAIDPVAASADVAPTGTVTVLPLTVDDTDPNACVFSDGLVGLEPHPAIVPRAKKEAALLQQAQNSRRLVEISVNLFTMSPHQVENRRRP